MRENSDFSENIQSVESRISDEDVRLVNSREGEICVEYLGVVSINISSFNVLNQRI